MWHTRQCPDVKWVYSSSTQKVWTLDFIQKWSRQRKGLLLRRGVYFVGYVTYGNTSNTFYLLLDMRYKHNLLRVIGWTSLFLEKCNAITYNVSQTNKMGMKTCDSYITLIRTRGYLSRFQILILLCYTDNTKTMIF